MGKRLVEGSTVTRLAILGNETIDLPLEKLEERKKN
jgi:hypothetical protein